MSAFLAASRPAPIAPDLFARFAPPATDWPWLLLCRWPPGYTSMVPADKDIFARGAYTIEAFGVPAELDRAEARLLTTLGPHWAVRVGLVSGLIGHA